MRDTLAAMEKAKEHLTSLQLEASELPQKLQAATMQALETGDTSECDRLAARRNQLPLLIAGAEIALCRAEFAHYDLVAREKGAERTRLRLEMNGTRDEMRRLTDEKLKPLQKQYGKVEYLTLDAQERRNAARNRLDTLLSRYAKS